jgi:hypothetical protein
MLTLKQKVTEIKKWNEVGKKNINGSMMRAN